MAISMEPITVESVGDPATLIPSFERSLRVANQSPKAFATGGEGSNQLLAFIRKAGMPTAVTEIGREHVESFIERLVETKAAATAKQPRRTSPLSLPGRSSEGPGCSPRPGSEVAM
jgi:hypothetical protein